MGNVLVKRNKKLKGDRRINVSVQEGTEGEVKVEEQEYVASAREDTAGQRGHPAQQMGLHQEQKRVDACVTPREIPQRASAVEDRETKAKVNT